MKSIGLTVVPITWNISLFDSQLTQLLYQFEFSAYIERKITIFNQIAKCKFTNVNKTRPDYELCDSNVAIGMYSKVFKRLQQLRQFS